MTTSVSPQAVFMQDYDTCFVNLQSCSELFTPPHYSQLCAKPATEVYTETSQRQREHTLYEYLYSSALPLDGAIRKSPGDAVEG